MLRTRSAQEIDEETVSAGDSFRKLAEESDAGVNVDAFSVTGVHDRAVLLGLAGILHGQEWRVLRIELRPEIEAAVLNPALEIALRDFVGPIEKRIRGLEKFHRRIFVGNARQRTRRRGCSFLRGRGGRK